MKKLIFEKSFTQQEPIPEDGISKAVNVLNSGRLHRYNVVKGELSETSLLEEEYANWQGSRYCIACTSGGFAIQLALRSIGIKSGTKVLANAFTLAPVPGAIQNVGAKPVFVETDENYHIDLNDLHLKAKSSNAKFLLLSHMRGHIVNMEKLMKICDQYEIHLIEDCAHTMGARWDQVRSGNFGKVAAFSSQTYKHINSGEGGFLITNDDDIAAKAVILSGSYMLFDRHISIPPKDVFDKIKLHTPNYSGRLDNLRAAILRSQIPLIESKVFLWNELYQTLYDKLSLIECLTLPLRSSKEFYVGSSIQFRIDIEIEKIPSFISSCMKRGVELKWFGDKTPIGYTSRYDSWKYFKDIKKLPQTIKILKNTLDMRIPLTFNKNDCNQIVDIIADELKSIKSNN